MPAVNDIIKCVKGSKIGERCLVLAIENGMYTLEILDTGLFDFESCIGGIIEVTDCDVKEYCIVEEK